MVDLTDIPSALNQNMFGGSNLLAAQLLVTMAVVMAFCFPALLAKKSNSLLWIFAIFATFFCVAMEWCPMEIGMLFIVAIAILGATKAGVIFGS